MLLLVAILLVDESALVEQLGSEDPERRENATRLLVERGAEALPILSKALESRDCEVQDRARRILFEIDLSPASPANYPKLMDLWARHRAAGVIGSIAEEIRTMPRLERIEAERVNALARLGPAAVPALLETAVDENLHVLLRVAVIDAIGKIRDPRAVKPLAALLHSNAQIQFTDG